MEANSLVIRGGNVVTEDAILPNHDIVVENGTIARIAPTPANARTVDAQLDENTSGMVVDRETGFPVVDARGAYVVPGMIDVHSDTSSRWHLRVRAWLWICPLRCIRWTVSWYLMV